jgi:hypothetical protein
MFAATHAVASAPLAASIQERCGEDRQFRRARVVEASANTATDRTRVANTRGGEVVASRFLQFHSLGGGRGGSAFAALTV